MEKCKICGNNTNSIVNINFKKIPLCNSCASCIMIQQAQYLIRVADNIERRQTNHQQLKAKISAWRKALQVVGHGGLTIDIWNQLVSEMAEAETSAV
jgi:ribosome-binding protein aMBF1 (putative translation factor)